MFGWASKPAFASSKAKSQPKGYNSTLFLWKLILWQYKFHNRVRTRCLDRLWSCENPWNYPLATCYEDIISFFPHLFSIRQESRRSVPGFHRWQRIFGHLVGDYKLHRSLLERHPSPERLRKKCVEKRTNKYWLDDTWGYGWHVGLLTAIC
jgi:hypothetical protein